MKKSLFIFFLTAALVAAAHSPASALIGVEARYWFTDLDGTVKSSEGGLGGTEIDFTDDLGMEDENYFRGRITLEFGNHRLRLSNESFGWDGQSTLTRTVNFMGKSYTASSAITSKLEIDYQRLSYDYALFNTLGNRVGFIMEIKHFDVEARLQAPALGFDEKESFDGYLPTIGVSVKAGLPVMLSFEAEVTGIGISDAYLYDGEVMVNFTPFPFITLSGGYRQFEIHAEDGEDDEFNLTVKGPFLNLAAGF